VTLEVFFGSVNAFLLAIVAFFLRQTWEEIRSLRVSRHEHANVLATHTAQIANLDDDIHRLEEVRSGRNQ
jgi:hypothetical protein